MTTAFSTTYKALKACKNIKNLQSFISRKELSKLRKFDKVKLKLYKTNNKKFLTTCRNNRIIPYFIKFKFSKILRFKTYNIQCN